LRARGRAVEAEIVGSRHNDARKMPTGHATWRASVQDRSQTEPAVANGRQRVTIRFPKISRPRRWFGACIGNRRRRATRPQARHARRHTFIWQRLRANYHSTWGWQWCPAFHHGPVLHALRPVHRSIGRLTPHRKRTTQLAADALVLAQVPFANGLARTLSKSRDQLAFSSRRCDASLLFPPRQRDRELANYLKTHVIDAT
jgi:hypothetical protein